MSLPPMPLAGAQSAVTGRLAVRVRVSVGAKMPDVVTAITLALGTATVAVLTGPVTDMILGVAGVAVPKLSHVSVPHAPSGRSDCGIPRL
jgi:hypothetical protein